MDEEEYIQYYDRDEDATADDDFESNREEEFLNEEK